MPPRLQAILNLKANPMPTREWREGVWLCETGPEPQLSEDLENLAYRLTQQLEGGGPDLVVDLSAVEFLNSVCLGRLIEVRAACQRGGGRLRLAGVTDRIWSVLLASNLDRSFRCLEDVSTALASLAVEGA